MEDRLDGEGMNPISGRREGYLEAGLGRWELSCRLLCRNWNPPTERRLIGHLEQGDPTPVPLRTSKPHPPLYSNEAPPSLFDRRLYLTAALRLTVHALAKQPTSLGSFSSRQKPRWKHLLPPPALLRTGPARRVGNLTLRSRSAGVWCALCAPLLVCLVCQQCFRSCHVDLRLQLRGEAVTDGVWSLQVPHRSEQLTRGVKEGWSHNARPSQHPVLSVRQLNGRGSVGRPHSLT